jgi:cysteinyl-tRNA synthetase
MPLRLYNSLTRSVEDFAPMREGAVNMFSCGPTVFDHIHIGNARAFTIFDVVAKWLRHSGYEVTYIQSVTDVDDKIIKRAGESGQDPIEYARKYEHDFRNDMQILGVDSVSKYGRATDHIPQILAQVKTLIAKGNVYLIEDDGWYFDLMTFPDYGKLSGRTGLAANDAVSRIDDSDKKRNTGDFCVWKLSKPGEPVWEDSELGAGRPGWHIEDTAITEHYFGPQYDLHGGGMDLKFPHHEAEIAQQEAASGKVPFVRYWMHAGFLENKGEKMSKSVGNFLKLREALKTWEPEVLRFYFLSNHYRAPLDFSDTSLTNAGAAVERIRELLAKIHAVTPSTGDDSALRAAITTARQGVQDAMDDDFNTAAAFAAMFELITAANTSIAQGTLTGGGAKAVRDFFSFIHTIFGIVPFEASEVPHDIQKLVAERQNARDQKDFTASDTLRDQLAGLGWKVDDTPYGPLVKKK